MNTDPLWAVEEAAAMNMSAGIEKHEPSAPEWQAHVAGAVTHGTSIKGVASPAHTTSLEILDAADTLTCPGRMPG
ncbi:MULTISPECIES: hypothetical protein [unclassified Arthrobacter]|uniref:hypothetical protein n=1 Tax=unclassified Arthrobacter TaxID=235627 RepID=UPI0027D90AD6|nr:MULTISPECIES: hypothetical protein [unclassified Arthrobacter]